MPLKSAGWLETMASPAGFEPTAPGLGILCSILLSYGDIEGNQNIGRAWRFVSFSEARYSLIGDGLNQGGNGNSVSRTHSPTTGPGYTQTA